jgi:hypothetical protein
MTNKNKALRVGEANIRLQLENLALKSQLMLMRDIRGSHILWEQDLARDLSGASLSQISENALARLRRGVDIASDDTSLLHNLHEATRPELLDVPAT